VGINKLQAVRNTFFHELCKLKVKVQANNKVTTGFFDKAEATAITNFFFTEVMGVSARQRLTSLITYYNSHEDEMIDVSVGACAEQLSLNDAVPMAIRRFYKSFS